MNHVSFLLQKFCFLHQICRIKYILLALIIFFIASHLNFYSLFGIIIIFLFSDQMSKKIGRRRKGPDLQQTELYDKITKIEANILKKIQELKIMPKITFCQHLNFQSELAEPYDPNTNYFDKYWKFFLKNELRRLQFSKLQHQNDHLLKRLRKIDTLFQQRKRKLDPYEKSRTKQIKKQHSVQFQCKPCWKFYDDEETLLLHNKIKHAKDGFGQAVEAVSEEIYEQQQNSGNES